MFYGKLRNVRKGTGRASMRGITDNEIELT